MTVKAISALLFVIAVGLLVLIAAFLKGADDDR